METAKTVGQLEVIHERRLVELSDGSLGYFHCWEHYSRPIDPSPLRGGGPGGTFCKCYALIEKSDGVVHRFGTEEFRFVDEENEMLKEMTASSQKEVLTT